jgi:hypothetical protein
MTDNIDIDTMFTIAGIIIATILSHTLENKRLNKPITKPYTWGYFCAITAMLGGAFMLISLLYFNSKSSYLDSKAQTIMVLGVGYGVLNCLGGYGWLTRNRLLAVVGIIVSLNPIWWIVNSIYLKNRWLEMDKTKPMVTPTQYQSNEVSSAHFKTLEDTNANIEPRKPLKEKTIASSSLKRAMIAIPVGWALLAASYTLIFEPYGNNMSSREWSHFWKITLFPMGVFFAGIYMYRHIKGKG